MRHRGTLLLAAAGVLLLAACGGDGSAPEADATSTAGTEATGGDVLDQSDDQLAVSPASFDLAVGDDRRFLAGATLADQGVVAGGEVALEFFYLGAETIEDEPERVATATGTFLAVPGKEPQRSLDAPTAVDPAEAAGVYETQVSFERPGFYGVALQADVGEAGPVTGTGVFRVAAEQEVIGIGDSVPAVDNLTLESDAEPAAIDSRAGIGDNSEIPDPHLHDATVAETLAAGEPMVIVISTPVYCVSQFCGPITDEIADLAREYDDRAEFIHLEVWRDFAASELNDAAAAFIQTAEGGNEPWVFVVGADGTVIERWDNVLDLPELVETLESLPSD